nr:hypothetical protein L203_05315 [Cryptococcus depauperatus CBS 7841]
MQKASASSAQLSQPTRAVTLDRHHTAALQRYQPLLRSHPILKLLPGPAQIPARTQPIASLNPQGRRFWLDVWKDWDNDTTVDSEDGPL